MKNFRLYILGLAIVISCLMGCDSGTPVEVTTPRRGTIRETFTESARTRLDNTYLITLPVEGRLRRVDLEPGDAVEEGQVLLLYDLLPLEQAVAEARHTVEEFEAAIAVLDDNQLEETALVETRALVLATEETLKAADKQVEAEHIRSERADKERSRISDQFEAGTVAQSTLDDAVLAAETALIELREKEFSRASLHAMMTAVRTGPELVLAWLSREQLQREEAIQKLAQAKARLAIAEHRLQLARVTSPIRGVVLEKYEDGDRALDAGTKVLLIGNLDELEVIADVLTADAMRLGEGAVVELRPASRFGEIIGHVRRVEPQGFTKLSSLGVEQQRVNVIVALDSRPANLGVGYRLEATFHTAEKDDALIVPRFSVLQAPDGTYFVYTVADGVLQRQPVTLGLRSDLDMEITTGLDEADVVVRVPDATMEQGRRIAIKK